MPDHPMKTALITGASSGLGAAFARRLAGQGFNLVLTARREERLAGLSAELTARHPGLGVTVLAADLATPEGQAAVEACIAGLPDLELLINNAGFGLSTPFLATDIEKTISMVTVHVDASVRLTRAALPGMLARNRGAVINVASVAAFFPFSGSVTYSATKAYLVAFSEALRTELAGRRVQVQALCPGFFYSEFHDTPELTGFNRKMVPGFLWGSAEAVVDASMGGLRRRKTVVVPGLLYRLGVSLVRYTPLAPLIGGIAGHMVRRKRFGGQP